MDDFRPSEDISQENPEEDDEEEEKSSDTSYLTRITDLIEVFILGILNDRTDFGILIEISKEVDANYAIHQDVLEQIFEKSDYSYFLRILFTYYDTMTDPHLEDEIADAISVLFLLFTNMHSHDFISPRMEFLNTHEVNQKYTKLLIKLVGKVPIPVKLREYFAYIVSNVALAFNPSETYNITDEQAIAYYKILYAALNNAHLIFNKRILKCLVIIISFTPTDISYEVFEIMHDFFEKYVIAFYNSSDIILERIVPYQMKVLDSNPENPKYTIRILKFWQAITKYDVYVFKIISKPIKIKGFPYYDAKKVDINIILKLIDRFLNIMQNSIAEPICKASNNNPSHIIVSILMNLLISTPQQFFPYYSSWIEKLRTATDIRSQQTLCLLVASCSVDISFSAMLRVTNRKYEASIKALMRIIIPFLASDDDRLYEYALFALSMVFDNFRKFLREIDFQLIEILTNNIRINEHTNISIIVRLISICYSICYSINTETNPSPLDSSSTIFKNISNFLLQIRFHDLLSIEISLIKQTYEAISVLVARMSNDLKWLSDLRESFHDELINYFDKEQSPVVLEHIKSLYGVIGTISKRIGKQIPNESQGIEKLIQTVYKGFVHSNAEVHIHAVNLMMSLSFAFRTDLFKYCDLKLQTEYIMKGYASNEENRLTAAYDLLRSMIILGYEFDEDFYQKVFETLHDVLSNQEQTTQLQQRYLQSIFVLEKSTYIPSYFEKIKDDFMKILDDLSALTFDPYSNDELNEASSVYSDIIMGYMDYIRLYQKIITTDKEQKKVVASITKLLKNIYLIGNLSAECYHTLNIMLDFVSQMINPIPALLLDNDFARKCRRNRKYIIKD